jgi:2-polyprenyl-3-methyl-5-hydroxy-6-metoxy-1,4-benzoquinol methylase
LISFKKYRKRLKELINNKYLDYRCHILGKRYNRDSADVKWLIENTDERGDMLIPMIEKPRIDFHLDRYSFALKYVENMDVADIACGTGYGSFLLSRDGHAKTVTGIDNDPYSVKYAQRYHISNNIFYEAADASLTGIRDERFDVVCSFETIEHIEDGDKMIREFYRITKPGGHLILSTPNDWGISKHHLASYNYDRIVNLIGKYFHIIQVYSQNSGIDRPQNSGKRRGIEIIKNNLDTSTAECFLILAKKINVS